MNKQEVYENLCWYDERNPNNDYNDGDTEPRKDCYCDNCFYGRDKLAMEIIRLWEE